MEYVNKQEKGGTLMHYVITTIANILRRAVVGSETERFRDQYYKDAEDVIKASSRFNWLAARIAVWRMRRARKRVENIFSVMLDPAFHEAVATYTKAIAPVVEQITEDEFEKAEASVEVMSEHVADVFKKFAPSA